MTRPKKSIQGAFVHVYKCRIGYSVIVSTIPDHPTRQDVVEIENTGFSRRILRLARALRQVCALHDAVYVTNRPLIVKLAPDTLAKLSRRTFAGVALLLSPQVLCVPEVFAARTSSWLVGLGADPEVFAALAPTSTMSTLELVSTSQMMADPPSGVTPY